MYTHSADVVMWWYQHSDLSSSTKFCVSLPVSTAGSNSLGRNCNCGDVLCVVLLGVKIADAASNEPIDVVTCFDLVTSSGTS